MKQMLTIILLMLGSMHYKRALTIPSARGMKLSSDTQRVEL